jgi:uncharacterized YigZ family protein
MDITAKGPLARIARRFDHEIEKVNGSRFLTTLIPAERPEQLTETQAELRAAHPHSRHVCFAYVGESEQQSRFSDDGEPNKTAGLPILRVMLGASLRHSGALVTRYFGGVKLGTGGLVRAYTAAVREALLLAPLANLNPTVLRRVLCKYASEPLVRHHLSRLELEPLAAEYGPGHAMMRVECPVSLLSELEEALGARDGGDVQILDEDSVHSERPDARVELTGRSHRQPPPPR